MGKYGAMTEDLNKAVRFARKIDAEAMVCNDSFKAMEIEYQEDL
jgi:hypothetical protein